jgi:transcriptional regulator with XRE-family HTH domain
MHTLGANMHRRRLRAHLTQTEAAQGAGMNWRHWQKIEAGTVNVCLASLVGIAHALDVTLPELFAPPPR